MIASAWFVPGILAVQIAVFSHLSPEQAEAAAVRSAPALLDARARVEENRYELRIARAALAPSLTMAYAQSPQGNPPGPNVISQTTTLGIQANLSDFLSHAPAVRQAALHLQAAQADEAGAEIAERIKVVHLYYDALAAGAIARARLSAFELAAAQRDAARAREAAGDAPRLDIIRAEVALAKASAELEIARAAAANAKETLYAETGCSEDMLGDTTPRGLPPSNSSFTSPPEAIALARRLRPEIASAESAIQAAREASRAARAAAFPTFTINAGYMVGKDSGVPVNGPSVNAQLTFPLSSDARRRAAISDTQVLQAQAKALQTQRDIELEVSTAARTLGASERAAEADARARKASEDELRAVEIGYRNGASSSLEVSAARTAYIQALVDELSSAYKLIGDKTALDIEIGRS